MTSKWQFSGPGSGSMLFSLLQRRSELFFLISILLSASLLMASWADGVKIVQPLPTTTTPDESVKDIMLKQDLQDLRNLQDLQDPTMATISEMDVILSGTSKIEWKKILIPVAIEVTFFLIYPLVRVPLASQSGFVARVFKAKSLRPLMNTPLPVFSAPYPRRVFRFVKGAVATQAKRVKFNIIELPFRPLLKRTGSRIMRLYADRSNFSGLTEFGNFIGINPVDRDGRGEDSVEVER